MTEQTQFMLSPKELTEALVKHHGLHQGIWSLAVEFQLIATNAGASNKEVLPAALVPVRRIGIFKIDKLNDISVDAAVVNPSARNGNHTAADRLAQFSRKSQP